MIGDVTNHLWQSTAVALAAGALSLLLRRNRAKVRYWIWLSASLKFLVPFALLASVGQHLESIPAARKIAAEIATPALSMTVHYVAQPFEQESAVVPTSSANAGSGWRAHTPMVLLTLWVVGLVPLLVMRFRAWIRIRASVRASKVLRLSIPVPARLSSEVLEPGVVGVVRPVLLLPEGILPSLTPQQFDAVLAHELCHVRRRDNLTSAMHMVVEVLFWFHPLVWWIGARLVEERERACDEEVLRQGTEPAVYAEGILNVCRLYQASPLACVSGVTGADLKQRIEIILRNRAARQLTPGRMLALLVAALTAILVPIAAGVVDASSAHSQATERLAFEVASVKPNEPSGQSMQAPVLQYFPSGRISARSVSITALVFEAYGVIPGPSGRINLNPEFQKSMDQRIAMETYDIEAIAEKGVISASSSPSLQREKLQLMLQTLLADRFKVRIRRETKEVPVYSMVVGRSGARLQKSTVDETRCTATSIDKPQVFRLFTGRDSASCHSFAGAPRFGLHAEAIDMADLAAIVERFSDRPVLDHTGLAGLYKIDTPAWEMFQSSELGPENSAPGDSLRPPLSALLQDVGLRLESTKAPVEMFVVEHFERPAHN